MAKLIKKEKDIRGLGLVEIIIGLLILFLISLG
jgi:Tfp pilus assembly protein PilW